MTDQPKPSLQGNKTRGVDTARLLGEFKTRFEIDARLGVGAHGAVYRAFDRERGARVALKVPHTHDAHGLLRVKDEFRALASVHHPNVVTFYELFVHEDAWFFTMQFVRGVDVLTHASRAPESIHEVLVGLAGGLEALHAQSIVHRDIKPSNAWVDASNTPILLDFGLARTVSSPRPSRAESPPQPSRAEADPEKTHARAGTPPYFAPELLDGCAPTASSDVYALGVLACEMLTGERPLPPLDTAERIPLERLRRIETPLSHCIDAMLHPDPSERPTASEIRATLGLQQERGTQRAKPEKALFAKAIPAALRDRDALAEKLCGAIEYASQGRPVVRFLHGPAGIGKSTLVERTLTRARALHPALIVLRGRCSEHETVPFATIDAVIDQLARRLTSADDALHATLDEEEIAYLKQAFPVFSSLDSRAPHQAPRSLISDPQERLRRIGQSLASVLAKVARLAPLVLVIDDAQWAEEDGARLLAQVMRTLHDSAACPPVTLLIAHRDAREASPALAQLLALRGVLDAESIAVTPLSQYDAESLAIALGAKPEQRARLLRESAGSPFLMEALALGGLEGPEREGASEDANALARAAIERRLSTLSEPARALFETICVANHPVPMRVAIRAAGLYGDLGSARSLAAARLVRTSPRHAEDEARDDARSAELSVYHDRLRELTLASVPDGRKSAIHANLAKALEGESGINPMWMCMHLEGAGELERAATYAESGARQALQSLAFSRAAELFRFAILHQKADRPDALVHMQSLHIALGEALANAGRGHEAARAYLDACVHERDPSKALDLRRSAAEQELRSGFFAEGTKLLNDVLREAGAPLRTRPSRAIVGLLRNRMWLREHGLQSAHTRAPDPAEARRIDACFSGAIGLSVVDSIRSADLMTEALKRSLSIGDERRRAAALPWYVAFLANGGGPAEASTRKVLEEARRAVHANGDAYARACLEAATALVEFHLGHVTRAEASCARSAAVFANETIGTTKELSTVHTFQLASMALLGRLRALSARTEELVHISESRGERYALTNYRQGLMILRHLAADAPARAREDLHTAMENFGAEGFVVQHYFDLWGRITTALYEGRANEARDLYLATRPRLLRSLLIRTQWTRGHTLVLEAATAIACIEKKPSKRARLWVEFVLAQLHREHRMWSSALASVLHASLSAAQGHRAEAVRRLDAAIPALDAAELGLYADAARAQLAEIRGDREDLDARDAWAEREGVKHPRAFAAALLPGFSRLHPRA